MTTFLLTNNSFKSQGYTAKGHSLYSNPINNSSDLRLIFPESQKLREAALTALRFRPLLLCLSLKLAEVAAPHLGHHALGFSQLLRGISQGQVVPFCVCASYLFQEHWKKSTVKVKNRMCLSLFKIPKWRGQHLLWDGSALLMNSGIGMSYFFINETDPFSINSIKMKSIPWHTTRESKMALALKFVPNDQAHSNDFKLLTLKSPW